MEQDSTIPVIPQDACYAREDDGSICGAPVQRGSYVCLRPTHRSQKITCIASKSNGEECSFKALLPSRTCGHQSHQRQEAARFAQLLKPATIPDEDSKPTVTTRSMLLEGGRRCHPKPKETVHEDCKHESFSIIDEEC